MKQEPIKLKGKVIETLGNANFRVELSNNHIILAHLAGKIRLNLINILNGDLVEVDANNGIVKILS